MQCWYYSHVLEIKTNDDVSTNLYWTSFEIHINLWKAKIIVNIIPAQTDIITIVSSYL